VARGETLWRISKIYNVDLDELAKVNHISDASSIETGQLIFLPYRQKQQAMPLADKNSSFEDFIWPIKGRVISSFGQTFHNMVNKGINIQPSANLDVLASRNGKVIFYASDFGGFGKTIIIDHGDGFSTVYARNSEVFVKINDNIKKGDVIAKAGTAGRDKNLYLHFEIRKGHIPRNPYFYLPQ
jgi:murein DD-endopeptidase MepM/ murein hydrolase activator NlpD